MTSLGCRLFGPGTPGRARENAHQNPCSVGDRWVRDRPHRVPSGPIETPIRWAWARAGGGRCSQLGNSSEMTTAAARWGDAPELEIPHRASSSCLVTGSSAVMTNRGWDTNDFLSCGKARATCGDSTGRQKPHTLTWFCGGSCGLQFVCRPTADQQMKSPHEQTARQCETANQRFVSKPMMANESSKLSF